MKHSAEIAELMRRINGKQVVYVDDNIKGCAINAILLAPPGGEVVTVKPYGYTPQELLELITAIGYNGYSLEKVTNVHFCLGEGNVKRVNIKTLEAVANIEDGGEYHTSIIDPPKPKEERSVLDELFRTNPSCLYG